MDKILINSINRNIINNYIRKREKVNHYQWVRKTLSFSNGLLIGINIYDYVDNLEDIDFLVVGTSADVLIYKKEVCKINQSVSFPFVLQTLRNQKICVNEDGRIAVPALPNTNDTYIIMGYRS
jgi:hypothetical protein